MTGQVVLWNNSQYLPAIIHAVRYVFNDCFPDYKVPAVNAVVDLLSFQHWSEAVSYPGIVEGAETDEDVILKVICLQVS